jgi:hypothetical protein
LDINSVSSALGLLSQFGSNAPALILGQVIEAVVLALLEDGSARLALPNATLDVRSTIPLTAETSVRLLVKSTGSGFQLVVSPKAPARDSTTAAISGGLGQTPDTISASEAAPIEDQAVNTTMVTSVEEQAVDLSIQVPNATTQSRMVRPAPLPGGRGRLTRQCRPHRCLRPPHRGSPPVAQPAHSGRPCFRFKSFRCSPPTAWCH